MLLHSDNVIYTVEHITSQTEFGEIRVGSTTDVITTVPDDDDDGEQAPRYQDQC